MKVIAKGKDDMLIVTMSECEFSDLQSVSGIDWDIRKSEKVGQVLEVKEIIKMHSDFRSLSEVKSSLKELMTKWQNILSRISVIEATKNK
jgi:hypothetical protein